MRRLAFFAAPPAFLLYCTCVAWSQWIVVSPPPLFSSIVQSSGIVYVGTHGGGVYTSSDQGTSFYQSRSGLTSLEITSMTSTPSGVYASTADAGIFVTSDNGISWAAANTLLISNNIRCVTAIGDTLLAGPVDYGAFFSNNGGQSWLPLGKGLGFLTVNTFFRSGAMVFAGTTNGLYRTTDGGKNWAASSVGLPANGSVVAISSVGRRIFTGIPGSGVYVSTDDGASWAAANFGLADLNVSCLTTVATLQHTQVNLIAGTTQGGLFLSADSGASWFHAAAPQSSNIVGALVPVDTVIFAAMGEGLRVSTDGGSNWSTRGAGLPNSEATGLAIAGGTLYLGMNHSGVFASQDKGSTWSRSNQHLSNNEVTAMATLATTVLVGTTGGAIFHRNVADSGWSIGGSGLNGFGVNAIGIAGTTTLAASGKRGIYYCNDVDQIWNFGFGSAPGINGTQAISFGFGQNVAIAGTLGFGILRSTDSGKHWVQSNSGLQDLTVTAVATEDSLFVATTASGIFVSEDAGINWVSRNDGLGSLQVSTLAITGNVAFAGTMGGGVFLSTDHGKRWHATGLAGGPPAIHLLYTDGHDLYAAGSLAGLSRCSIPDLLSTIVGVHDGERLPSETLLWQNFPNPFNPKTVVSGQWTVNSDVRLEVFDILGRKVATLANGRYPAGKYAFPFDGTNLASGVYLYRLTAGKFTATRSMILMK